ncbi:MAG: 4a-hydroxytetrahydrobiopterin dehydratase [Flavobacteriales bacterium]|nr:4a-hydroxytetrahydrobiopterin dehydratase [Flavobacteriales bacterium]
MEVKNWEKVDNALVRDLAFRDQTELAEFVLRVAKYSDEVEHHADMEITEFRKLRMSITSHDAGALTEKDYTWAQEVNDIVQSFPFG